MRKLIAFLIKYSVAILFLVLEVISLSMIVKNNDYQKSVFFSSSNTWLAGMYEMSNSVVEFFQLKNANESLANENTILKNKLADLEVQLASIDTTSYTKSIHHPDKEIRYISAKVINNSINKTANYITINKGSRDGIGKDMSVINEDGFVGIVSNVSEKYAVVIPIINPKIKINSKFKHNNYTGPVHWEGMDYRFAQLNDIARHVEFSLGDSLVTSGFNIPFPEGILVGTVDDFHIRESDNYYDIKIKLAVNFRTLSYVKVVQYLNFEEQTSLENKAAEL